MKVYQPTDLLIETVMQKLEGKCEATCPVQLLSYYWHEFIMFTTDSMVLFDF